MYCDEQIIHSGGRPRDNSNTLFGFGPMAPHGGHRMMSRPSGMSSGEMGSGGYPLQQQYPNLTGGPGFVTNIHSHGQQQSPQTMMMMEGQHHQHGTLTNTNSNRTKAKSGPIHYGGHNHGTELESIRNEYNATPIIGSGYHNRKNDHLEMYYYQTGSSPIVSDYQHQHAHLHHQNRGHQHHQPTITNASSVTNTPMNVFKQSARSQHRSSSPGSIPSNFEQQIRSSNNQQQRHKDFGMLPLITVH